VKPVKIFLCDLTYDTTTLSTEAFPLNIGYIASYTKQLFNNDVEISLFKYIDKLETILETSTPDIIGFSNYAWNRNISTEMSKIFLEKNPNGIVVWGGPNFPQDYPSQLNFLKNLPLDLYVPIEGEFGFANIVRKALSIESKSNFRKEMLDKPISGCISKLNNGKIETQFSNDRIKNLDEIKSPYLTGILDEFFDGRLSPMLQTNRGCPFSCTFCVDGSATVNQINQFSSSRVDNELQYISKKVTSNMHSLLISDLNFGMYPKDMEVCDSIQKIQNETNFPRYVKVTSGKNRPDRISEAIKKLGDTTSMTLSVQSLNDQVLANIKRHNISSEKLIALSPTLRDQGLQTVSEIILGLPGETYETILDTIRDILRANIDEIYIYTMMLLDGSELNTPAERSKWNFNTKFRILPRDFVKLKNGKVVLEIEEVVVGSNTLSFEEYVEVRLLALMVLITQITPSFQALFKFMKQYEIETFDLLFRMLKNINLASPTLQKLFNDFKQSTIDELWNSKEEIENFYQNPIEYQKLLDGNAGQNLLFYYHASCVSECMIDFTNFVLETSSNLLEDKKISNYQDEFSSISDYCLGICHNIFGDDRMETNPKFLIKYDIMSWLKVKDSTLKSFPFPTNTRVTYKLTNEQFKELQDYLSIFGNNKVGRSQVIKVINTKFLWRSPVITSSSGNLSIDKDNSESSFTDNWGTEIK
tara:strand:+ start:1948 stop:4050 length:2103 start_codon:yes stop_codon:yes gene_type:complete